MLVKKSQKLLQLLWTCHQQPMSTDMKTASLYIHWPFCEKRCTYCNFNKYIRKSEDLDRFAACLEKEIQSSLAVSGVKKLASVFFGGGTPSLADPMVIDSILKKLDHVIDTNIEVTLEANPTSLETQKLKDFRAAGVNRISLGVQALDDEALKILGRNHTVADSLRCLEIAKHLFPGKTSIDVMFGRPFQTENQWQKELTQIIDMADDHMSLYQLTMERGTALFKQVMDRQLFLPSQESVAQMYISTVQTLSERGFHRYEASNFARSLEAESEHNKWYWRAGEYIGAGPGAHSRFVPAANTFRESRVQTLEPEPWMYEVETKGHATRKITQLLTHQVLEEYLMLGLRTTTGVLAQRWLELGSHLGLSEIFQDSISVRSLQQEGFLELTNESLKATETGLNVVDSITPELMNILDKQLKAR